MEQTKTTPTPEIILTEEQQTAVAKIKAWFEDKHAKLEYKLGGYAGTGKTTVIKAILKALSEHSTVVSAFTGKAVNVLERKGVPAQTLHSLIYDCEIVDKKPTFVKKGRRDVVYDLIIIDEASMISTELYNDLSSFGIKVLFVGDPGQLEPVGDNPNLMLFPDFVLSKIHRQAEQSPIIFWANEIRQGRGLDKTLQPKGDGFLIRDKNIKTSDFFAADQLICAKNKTREAMNAKVREAKHLQPCTLVEGEKIIVLRNNIQEGVFNGMILFVKKIVAEKLIGKYNKQPCWLCDCVDEVGKGYQLPIWKPPFQSPTLLTKDAFIPRDVVYATYGYVITCHKAQGSEWDNLIVFDEWMPEHIWDMKRWRYTAITRAAKQLTYCM